MAAGRIRGITIVIDGDSTKLTKALGKVDSALKNTQSNLRDLDKALKLDPGNVNLIKDKQDELAKAIDSTKERIKAETTALEQMRNTEGFDANSKAANDLRIQIDLDTAALKELEKQAKESSSILGKQLQIAGEKMQAFGEKVKGVGDKISGIGSALSAKVTAPIVTAFGLSVQAAIDWESAFTGVMKTVDETANTSYEDLKRNINEIAKTTASSQNEIAAVMEIAGQLGVGADYITDFTRTMVMLGDTTNLTSEEAASAIAKFANVTGMSLNDTDKLGSVIVDLGNNFATTEADIMSMATRLSAAGTSIGLSQGEILGFATALSSVGIEAEMGGSAFSKAMKKMQVAAETGFEQVDDLEKKTGMSLRDLELMSSNASKDFKALADSLGLTSKEMNQTITAGKNLNDFAKVANMSTEEFVNLYRTDAPAAIQAFISGLGDTESHGESTIAMLQEMGFTEVRLSDTLTRLANSGDLVTEAVDKGNQAWSDNVAMQNEAAKRYETMEARISQLKSRITEVGVSIGETLIPHIEKAVGKIEELTDKWMSLGPEQQEAIIKFAAIAAAIGPALVAIGKVVSSVGTLISAFGKIASLAGTAETGFSAISTALGALTGPIGLIIAAIAALVAGFVYLFKTNDEFRAHIMGTVDDIRANFQAALEEIQPKLEVVKEKLSALWESIKSGFKDLMTLLAPVFEFLFQLLAGFVNSAIACINPLVDFVVNIVDVISNIVEAFIALIHGDTVGFLTNLIEAYESFKVALSVKIEIFIAAIKGFWMTFGVDIQKIIDDTWNKLITKLAAFLLKCYQKWTSKWNEIKSKTDEILEKIRSTFESWKDNLRETFENLIESMKNWGSEMIEGFIDGIKSKIEAVKDVMGDVAEAIAEFIHFSHPDKGPLAAFPSFAPDMMKLFAKGITDNANLITDAVANSFDIRPLLTSQLSGLMTANRQQGTLTSAEQKQPINVTVMLQGDAGRLFRVVNVEADRNREITGQAFNF